MVFNSAEFLSIYPQFTPQSPALPGNFVLATTQLANTCGSKVQDAPTRQTLLYLLTAHITQLLNGVGSTPASGVVGRVSDGTEGSVSVRAEYEATAGPSQAYYLQTPFGALYWQSTARFRLGRYHAPRSHTSFPYFGGGCGCG